MFYQVPVGGPDEVDEIFDAISYSKGASVIGMLHNYIGDAVCIYIYHLIQYQR
jgi:aminopeptidase N